MSKPKSVSFYCEDKSDATTWKVCPTMLKAPYTTTEYGGPSGRREVESFKAVKPDAQHNNLNNKILNITLPNGVKAQYLWTPSYRSRDTEAMTEAKLREAIINRKPTGGVGNIIREFNFVLNPRDEVFYTHVPKVCVSTTSINPGDRLTTHNVFSMVEWTEECRKREVLRANIKRMESRRAELAPLIAARKAWVRAPYAGRAANCPANYDKDVMWLAEHESYEEVPTDHGYEVRKRIFHSDAHHGTYTTKSTTEVKVVIAAEKWVRWAKWVAIRLDNGTKKDYTYYYDDRVNLTTINPDVALEMSEWRHSSPHNPFDVPDVAKEPVKRSIWDKHAEFKEGIAMVHSHPIRVGRMIEKYGEAWLDSL